MYEALLQLINDLRFKIYRQEEDRAENERYFMIKPFVEDFGYVYRRLAYFTSQWEDVFITTCSCKKGMIVVKAKLPEEQWKEDL